MPQIIAKSVPKSVAEAGLLKHNGYRICTDRLKKRTTKNDASCTHEKVVKMFSNELKWKNPCNSVTSSENSAGHTNLTEVRTEITITLKNTKFESCIFSKGISYCHKARNYSFLEHRRTNKICLRLEHKRLQLFVAAFDYLKDNDFLMKAKSLLCEIETAINQTGAAVPKTIPGMEMCQRLDFESIDGNSSNVLDVHFAKTNFGKYLKGLGRTIQNTTKITSGCSCNRDKSHLADSSNGSKRPSNTSLINPLNQSNTSGTRRRKAKKHTRPNLSGSNDSLSAIHRPSINRNNHSDAPRRNQRKHRRHKHQLSARSQQKAN